MRILILKGGALGDFIVTLPALRLLRGHWPDARIELVGNARAGELAVLAGLLDAVHSEHEARWAALFRRERLPAPLSTWLDSFDLVINYGSDRDGLVRVHFAHRASTYVSHDATRFPTRPAGRSYCEGLRPLGLTTTDFRAVIDLPDAVHAEAAQRLGGFRDFVAIHPGSGSPTKNWPSVRWTELCKRFHRPILAITGEAEGSDTVVDWPDDLFVQRAHQWPLPLLAAAIRRGLRYLGHDTGISHLAAAVGAPTFVLFGPTDPSLWAPQGQNVVVLKNGNAVSDITVDDVFFAVAERLR